jgi:hypothetical protein
MTELHAIPHDERGPHQQDIELAAISQRVQPCRAETAWHPCGRLMPKPVMLDLVDLFKEIGAAARRGARAASPKGITPRYTATRECATISPTLDMFHSTGIGSSWRPFLQSPGSQHPA